MCSKSFYFAHRVLWFLNSTNFLQLDVSNLDPQLYYLYRLIQTIVKVSSNSTSIFIEKGDKLQGMMIEAGLKLCPEGIMCVSMASSDKEIVRGLKKYSEEDINELTIPIEPKNISLYYFPNENGYEPFSASLSFIERLTAISVLIMKSADKKAVLEKELAKVNSILPACVYIPFNNPKIRDAFVLHIPLQEAKVFTTKERAPYLISIEVFRPHREFMLNKNYKNNYLTKSFSDSQGKSFTKSFATPESPSFLERALRETFAPNAMKFTNKSVLIPSRVNSYSVGHYSKVVTNNDLGPSLAAVYEANEETKKDGIIKSFKQQADRIRKSSPYGTLKTWDLIHVIVKSGDDLRQEQLAMQIISFFLQTFKEKDLKLWLYAYDIIATGQDCGILECVPDAISIDALKKATERKTLLEYFIEQYGGEDSRELKAARKEFMKSLAGYSLLCYILQIKDRHNGNILLDRYGHLVHIDFGFMISNSPGGNMNFEKAPFKLTQEFENLLGGRRSNLFIKFRSLCVKGYIALKEKAEQIILMVEMMRTGSGASLGCFSGGEEATKELRRRLIPRERMSEGDSKHYINELIDESLDNWSTRCYDRFQYCCQNIFY